MLRYVTLRDVMYQAKYTLACLNINRPCRSHFHPGLPEEFPARLHPCQHFALVTIHYQGNMSHRQIK